MKSDKVIEFMTMFGSAMEGFGSDYIKQTGRDVNGELMVRALIRWVAATIASAPEEGRATILLNAISQLHSDLAEAESRGLPEAVRTRRQIN